MTPDPSTEALREWPTEYALRSWTLAQIVGNAHQIILNAPRKKDDHDYQAMRLLEAAYARLQGVR